MTYPVKTISVSIDRSVDAIYQFASDPENFPKWVEFITSMTKKNESEFWTGATDMGDIKIKFVPQNDLGVIDHEVMLPNGERVSNYMRVVANNEGSELIFTLFWMPGRTEDEFNRDARAVEKDLKRLKELMESK